MLFGAAAAVIPLVLHMLSRARHRTVDWGAMMFLISAEGNSQRNWRVSLWLPLLIRIGIVALLAVTLSRPIVRGGWTSSARVQPVTVAIVLDASGSTAYDEGGRTRLDLIRNAALGIIGALRPGDRVSLIVLGNLGNADESQPTADLRSVAERITSLQPGQSIANLAQGLSQALNILEKEEPVHRDIFLLADRQAVTWHSLDSAFAAKWSARLANSQAPTRVFAIRVGNAQSDSVMMEQLALTNPPVIRSQPAEVELRVRNRGATPRAALPVRVLLGDKVAFETHIDLAPEQSISVRGNIVTSQTGSQLVTAELRKGGLAEDDRRMLAVDVVPPLRVLVLSGDERAATFRGESDFFRLALAPYQSGRQLGLAATQPTSAPATPAATDAAAVDVRPIEQWAQVNFTEYQVVVLANVERFEQAQVRRLEQFVYGGGGLLVAPGNLSRVTEYNEWLYRGGAGLLPAELSPATPGDGSQATTLLGYEPAHPVFRFTRGRGDPLPRATVGRYFPAAVRRPDSQVLASYASGAPFLIETSRWGRGRVLLMTTPLDADWSTLPLSNFYLPLMQSIVRHLSGGGVQNRNLQPGERLTFAFDTPAEERSVELEPPDSRKAIRLSVLPYGTGEVRFENTWRPGLYRLLVNDAGERRVINYVVQPPADEADLTQIPDADWQAIARTLNLKDVNPEPHAIGRAIVRDRDGRELWSILVLATIGLGITEIVFLRRWGLSA